MKVTFHKILDGADLCDPCFDNADCTGANAECVSGVCSCPVGWVSYEDSCCK